MKIDFIIGSLNAGGAERVVSRLANHFAEKGYIVRVITFRDGDGYSLHPSVSRIRLHNDLKFFNYTIFKAFIYLFKFYWYKQNRPKIISSHIDLLGLATIPVAKFLNIKIVVTEHFNHFNQEINFSKRILWNYFYKLPDAITVLTNFDKPYFEQRNKRVRVILNPCSFEPIENLNTLRKKEILAIGDLNRLNHKGFDNLIDIAISVLPYHSDWKLKIIGQGDEGLKFLKNKLNNSPIENQVIFTGYRNDINELMRSAEIFILTSRHEGLPLVLIEAMSQGMACISYNCISGPSDIITNNIDGVLIQDQDIKEMCLKLNQLIGDSSQRKFLRNNTPKSLNKFSIEEIGSQWENLFKEIIENN
ncbi:glycosyltransferase family 4 protein [uncultured Maribacter sp.]|uniref:glycosyltransferase family 4 protein n=1 Tax=uncultured Maribacter sp. TaxID=431308 RepID=UPI0030D7A068